MIDSETYKLLTVIRHL